MLPNLHRSGPVWISKQARCSSIVRVSFLFRAAQSSKTHALTLLIEVLGAKSLPGSLELITSLLETLTRVAHDAHAVSADRTYNEQLLMNALESCVNNMPVCTQIQGGALSVY